MISTKNKDTISIFQALLKSERSKRSLTMREASIQAGMLNPQTWEAYENGRREPTISQANRMLAVFGMGVFYE